MKLRETYTALNLRVFDAGSNRKREALRTSELCALGCLRNRGPFRGTPIPSVDSLVMVKIMQGEAGRMNSLAISLALVIPLCSIISVSGFCSHGLVFQDKLHVLRRERSSCSSRSLHRIDMTASNGEEPKEDAAKLQGDWR